jgi:hypothetical protein
VSGTTPLLLPASWTLKPAQFPTQAKRPPLLSVGPPAHPRPLDGVYHQKETAHPSASPSAAKSNGRQRPASPHEQGPLGPSVGPGVFWGGILPGPEPSLGLAKTGERPVSRGTAHHSTGLGGADPAVGWFVRQGICRNSPIRVTAPSGWVALRGAPTKEATRPGKGRSRYAARNHTRLHLGRYRNGR